MIQPDSEPPLTVSALPLTVAIVGSSNYRKPENVAQFVRDLPPNTVVVSGAATGVDTWAERTAKACGLRTVIFPVDRTIGPDAPYVRNQEIVDFLLAQDGETLLQAFWDGTSNGTKDAMDRAASACLRISCRYLRPVGAQSLLVSLSGQLELVSSS